MTPPTAHALLAQADWVRRLARSLVHDVHDADDVVQEAWLAALRSGPRPGVPLRNWLGAVVLNATRKRGRTRSRVQRREARAARPDRAPPADDVIARAETQRRVVDAVLALAEPYRTTVLLRYFEDLPPREVAQRMDAPVATVKSRLARAQQKLRLALDDREPGSGARALAPLLAWSKGGLIVKKIALVAGLLLLALALWTWQSSRSRPVQRTPAAKRKATPVAPPEEKASKDAPPASTYHGRVLTRFGEPIANAAVHLVAPPRPVDLVPAPVGAADPVPRAPDARTDADGRFTLSAAPGRGLLVDAPGFLCEHLRYAGGIVVRLRERPIARGRVRLADGTPVANATVSLLAGTVWRLQNAYCLAATKTDAGGLFAFPDHGAGTGVIARHPDYAGALVHRGDPPASWEIILSPLREVRGVVVHADERPAAGVDVRVTQPWSSWPVWSVRTDSVGAFAVQVGVHGNACEITADAGKAGNRVVHGASLDGPIRIVLPVVTALRGRITGPPAGELAGRRVHVQSHGYLPRVGTTDAEGRFEIKGVPEADLAVVFDPHDREWEEAGPRLGRYQQFKLRSPPFEEIEFALQRKTEVDGIVLDETGAPVPHAWLTIDDAHASSQGANSVGFAYPLAFGPMQADDEGRFRLTGVSRRRPVSALVQADGFVMQRIAIEDSPVEVRLLRGLKIEGHVIHESGEPLAGVLMRTYRRRADQSEDLFRGHARTDAHGRYSIGALPPGNYTVWVEGRPEWQRTYLMNVPAGSTAETIVVRAAHVLTGRVTDERGYPVAGAAVSTWNRKTGNKRVKTDADGRYEIGELAPGTYHVQFSKFEWAPLSRKDVAIPRAGSLEVVLSRGLTIDGVVLDASGQPLPGVAVRAEKRRPDFLGGGVGFADDKGRFVVRGLPPGEYRLTVETRGPTAETFAPRDGVAAGSTITLQAQAGAFVGGRVLTADGAPISGAWVTVIRLDGERRTWHGASRAGGKFRVGPVLGARFAVAVRHKNRHAYVPEARGDVEVRLRPGMALAGRAVNADGKPVRGSIYFTRRGFDRYSFRAEAGKDGTFRIDGLPAGAYYYRGYPFGVHLEGGLKRGPMVQAGTEDLEVVIKNR